MDTIHPQVFSAIIASLISLIVAIASAFITLRLANNRAILEKDLTNLRAYLDTKLARVKVDLDTELAEQKSRIDNKTIFAAERVAHELMMNLNWKWRSFRVIKHHLGGFEDDELRKILVRAGAIRIKGPNYEEFWGLLDRNRDLFRADEVTDPQEGLESIP